MEIDNALDHQLLRAGLWKSLPVVWKRKNPAATLGPNYYILVHFNC